MSEVAIYGLFDPRNLQIRYIGKTANTKKRLRDHINAPCNMGMKRWFSELKLDGLRPGLCVIEWCNNWKYAEKFWISEFRLLDNGLLNVREGANEGVYSKEVGAKISSAKKGARFTEEHKAKLRAAKVGRSLTEEHKEKIRASGIGRVQSEETRAKISRSHLGKTASEETKSKMRERRKGRKLSASHRENIGRASRGRKLGPLSEEHKAILRKANLGKVVPMEVRIKISKTLLEKKRAANGF